MITKVGFISLIAGATVLVGNYVSSLQKYPLIPIGAGLAILAAIVDNWTNKEF